MQCMYNLAADNNTFTLLEFEMSVGRSSANVVEMSSGRFWMTGGLDNSLSTSIMKSTDIFHTANRSFTPGPNLPYNLCAHCVIRTPADAYILIGGLRPTHQRLVRKYDFATNAWTSLPNMPRPTAVYNACLSLIHI